MPAKHSTPPVLSVGADVRMTDPAGGSVVGYVDAITPDSRYFVLDGIGDHDEDAAEFELGADGRWYEINDGQTPWTLEVL